MDIGATNNLAQWHVGAIMAERTSDSTIIHLQPTDACKTVLALPRLVL